MNGSFGLRVPKEFRQNRAGSRHSATSKGTTGTGPVAVRPLLVQWA